jgi:hypothetical protein
VADAQAAAEEVRHRAHQKVLEEARIAVAREEAAVQAVAPGFPTGDANSTELAEVLSRLVHDRQERFEAGVKSFGRTRWVWGWGFLLRTFARDPDDGPGPPHEQGVVITVDGRMQLSSRGWRYLLSDPILGPKVSTLGADHVRIVRDQVLRWLGVAEIATPEERRLAAGHPPLPRRLGTGAIGSRVSDS